MPAYRLPAPYDRTPLQRRAGGLSLALAVNLGLFFILMGLGVIPAPPLKRSGTLVVDMMPESHPAQRQSEASRTEPNRPEPKPPPVALPAKPTIASSPRHKSKPWIEMSHDELASADLRNIPPGSDSDSEEVGRGPHGEVLYAAEWARHPTNAEIGGYFPPNAPDGWGLIACKTIPEDRVDDCVELDQSPPGSHLASAVRQAAWQFRVRPPRKNGRPLVGEWVEIRIDYHRTGG